MSRYSERRKNSCLFYLILVGDAKRFAWPWGNQLKYLAHPSFNHTEDNSLTLHLMFILQSHEPDLEAIRRWGGMYSFEALGI